MKNKWNIGEMIKKVDEKVGKNLDRVGVYLQGEIVNSFGSGGTPGSGGTRGKVHSSPGEPPYVQTGTLRRSITFQREGTRLLVGSSLKPQGSDHSYAWYLEMGSGRMAPRPYLRPAVRKNKGTIRDMVAGRA